MNINIQCCGIVLLLIIIIMYSRNQRLPLRSNKVFQRNLYVTFACLVEDVACVLAIYYADRLPWPLVVLLSRTHMAFMVLVSMLAVVYVVTSAMYHLPVCITCRFIRRLCVPLLFLARSRSS